MTEQAADGPLRLYFACVGNSCRSQMAEGLARRMGGDQVEVKSGGSRPAGRVSRNAITTMAEIGIDISDQTSDPLDNDWVAGCDLVVTMGCGEDACPAFHEVELEDWPLEDPVGQDLATFRETRDEIGRRMRGLFDRLGIVTKT